ncbi:unnamed protein product [Symbiodinium pilosum]|uniref:Uncharacterized protein n=1 Tax=Symbiodinium pilosum TaxID=2952 RepID=A0A812WT70_SYMPI|nr:unnamed protein product [Symbiodinium pilosum]
MEVQKATFLQSLTLRQERFYEVVICNFTGRPLHLQGCKDPAARVTVAGRLLRLLPEVSPSGTVGGRTELVERVLLHQPESHPSPTVQAKFQPHSNCGDLLEFTVVYLNAEGSGVTIRVNAHDASTMRSSIQVHGQDLEGTSVVEELPRMRVRPPEGYAQTSLGVHARPDKSEPVHHLNVNDEVMLGMGPCSGRWHKITHPAEGWVQAATRDGRLILHEMVGCRPNLRQVITLRPASCRPLLQQPALVKKESPCRKTEHALFQARAAEACRLSREIARLEASGPSGTPRKSTLGVF